MINHHYVREACHEDFKSIARLINILGYGENPLLVGERLQAYRDHFSRVFVALHNVEAVGFLSFHAIPLFHEAAMLGRITAMAVDPGHHREGIGSSLVKAAENFCRLSRLCPDGSYQWRQ